MNLQNILSVCVFAMFAIIVLIRAAILRNKGIKTIVFGATDKSDKYIAGESGGTYK